MRSEQQKLFRFIFTSSQQRVLFYERYAAIYKDHFGHAEIIEHCTGHALSSRRFEVHARVLRPQRNQLYGSRRRTLVSRATGVHVPRGYKCRHKGHLSMSSLVQAQPDLDRPGPYTQYASAAGQSYDTCQTALRASQLGRPNLETFKKPCGVANAFHFCRMLLVKRHSHCGQYVFKFNLF